MNQTVIMVIVIAVYVLLAAGYFAINLSAFGSKKNTVQDGASKAIILAAIGWSLIWPIAFIVGILKSRK